MSEFENFKAAIFGQESGNGKADTSKPNYAGALGKGQILEKTFNGLKASGKLPANYEWTNPQHNEEGAIKYMEEAWQAGGGKPELAAAYYYGGPKAIKGGVINTFGDLKNAKAPTTNEYAASVLQRMGVVELPTSPRRIDNAIDRRPEPGALDRHIRIGMQASLVRPGNADLWQARLEQDASEQAVVTSALPTEFERFGAGVAGNIGNRLLGVLRERVFAPAFPPEEGFVADVKNLPAGADSDLIEEYHGAKSAAQAAHIVSRYEEEQMRTKTLMTGGAASGIGYAFLGELVDPVNYIAPFAAAKGLASIGMGSIALAQQGRAGASIASAIGENVLSSTALEAVVQGLEGRVKPQDLLVNLAVDTLLGGAVGAFGARAIRSAEKLTGQAAESAALREAGYAARAEAQLGPNASAAEMTQAMDIMFTKDVNEVVQTALADVPTESKIVTAFDESPRNERTPSPRFDPIDKALNEETILATKPGVHLSPTVANDPVFQSLAKDADSLASQFLPSVHSITLTRATEVMLPSGDKGTPSGIHMQVGDKHSVIVLDPTSLARGTLTHEIGHAVDQVWLSKVSPEIRAGLIDLYTEWLGTYNREGFAKTSLVQRGPTYRVGTDFNAAMAVDKIGEPVSLRDMRANELGSQYADEYYSKFSEFLAEQFNKHIEAEALNPETKLKLSDGLIEFAKENFKRLMDIFKRAISLGYLKPDTRASDFFEEVLKLNKAAKEAEAVVDADQFAVAAKPAAVVNEVMTDPDAVRFGLTMAPVGTATERKQAQAMLALHKQADQWAIKNPRDKAWQKRAKNLADNNVFNVASTGLKMLNSESNLVRMIASELLEDASGVAGKRKSTAAISKHIVERAMLGNVIPDCEAAYGFWKVGQPGGHLDDMVGGTRRAAFEKAVASEIGARRIAKGPVSQDLNIKAAADSLEAGYQRIANALRKVGTLGNEGLPKSSVGYMPHHMSAKAVINLTNEQTQVLHSALVDQFVTIEGWDVSFSDQLASSYIKRVRDRASGGYGSNIGGGNPGAASMVEEALRGMDLPEDTIKAHMAKFSKGAANFTKGRIELDLNKVYQTSTGEFKLLDIFETNQIELFRSQAGRASGEVALTQHGVRGKPGLQLLRDALQYGEDGKKASIADKEAYDQIAAEFLNEPFGTQSGKFMERAMAANTLVRLGGIAFNQIAESINAVFHVGAMGALDSVASIPRLNREIRALVRGEKVDNPFISSIELAGGAEFGTDAYKIVMPFDSPDHAFPTYGQDTLTLTDRLLRGGGYLQAKLSGWRLIHSAQQRGMAEQIVHKMMRYVREGKDDVALDQFGINAEVRAALKGDLAKIATFDGNRLTRFDVTQITDPAIRDQVIQAVWRGTSQIIQGTYIGERGKWAHDGWLKLLTQFRTFPLTSMEKQWGRQRNSHGSFAAFGMLIGSMSIAAPIYMARTYAASIGRPDQEAFLEERLNPQAVARATLNYVAQAGMAGDFIDLTSAVLPTDWGIKPTGGRAGVESDFVGNYVLPASSLVNDIWGYAQSPLSAQDAAKILPMSRLPFLLPLTNLTRE